MPITTANLVTCVAIVTPFVCCTCCLCTVIRDVERRLQVFPEVALFAPKVEVIETGKVVLVQNPCSDKFYLGIHCK